MFQLFVKKFEYYVEVRIGAKAKIRVRISKVSNKFHYADNVIIIYMATMCASIVLVKLWITSLSSKLNPNHAEEVS